MRRVLERRIWDRRHIQAPPEPVGILHGWYSDENWVQHHTVSVFGLKSSPRTPDDEGRGIWRPSHADRRSRAVRPRLPCVPQSANSTQQGRNGHAAIHAAAPAHGVGREVHDLRALGLQLHVSRSNGIACKSSPARVPSAALMNRRPSVARGRPRDWPRIGSQIRPASAQRDINQPSHLARA